jgi:hypothetical protein
VESQNMKLGPTWDYGIWDHEEQCTISSIFIFTAL